MNKRIVITTWKVENEMSYLDNMFRDDEELKDAVNDYFNHNVKPDTEVFKKEKNIIISEAGCFGAFYEDELDKV